MGGEREFPYQPVLTGNHRFSERSVEPVKIGWYRFQQFSYASRPVTTDLVSYVDATASPVKISWKAHPVASTATSSPVYTLTWCTGGTDNYYADMLSHITTYVFGTDPPRT